MLREQMSNFLQSAVIVLLMTNALSAIAAAYAMRLAISLSGGKQGPTSAVERKLEDILRA
jgi:hypothetical protein